MSRGGRVPVAKEARRGGADVGAVRHGAARVHGCVPPILKVVLPRRLASQYRGTLRIRNSAPIGPYSRPMPRVL